MAGRDEGSAARAIASPSRCRNKPALAAGDAPAFSDLARRGLLNQRVGDPIEPGGEKEPYVPDVGTRARARARFILEHAGESGLIMSWDRVIERGSHRVRTLFDPFAEAYSG